MKSSAQQRGRAMSKVEPSGVVMSEVEQHGQAVSCNAIFCEAKGYSDPQPSNKAESGIVGGDGCMCR